MPTSQLDPERGWVPAEPLPTPVGIRLERWMRATWRRLITERR